MVSFGSLIYVSADLDVQLILEVAQDLLDGAVDLLGVQFRLGIGQHQRESHALLALAQVLAAVDVEQAHPGDQGACAADGILDLAAGDSLIADQRQVALDRRKGADGAVVQFALDAAGQRLSNRITAAMPIGLRLKKTSVVPVFPIAAIGISIVVLVKTIVVLVFPVAAPDFRPVTASVPEVDAENRSSLCPYGKNCLSLSEKRQLINRNKATENYV